MADLGAAFGFYPQLNRRRQGSPADSANLPVDVLRGRLAGLLGLPADIANLLRSPSPTEMFGNVSYEAPAQFPYTTEKFLKDLPLAPTSRVGQVAGQAASFVPLNPMPAVRGVQKIGQMAGEELAATMMGQRPNSMMSKVVPQPLFAVAPEQGLLATKTEPIESLLQTKPQAPVSDIGFYSATEQAALNLGRNKGTGQSFINDLMKAPDVKKEELQFTGLEDFLRDKPNVTKQEVQDFLANNRVDVQEVTYGSQDFSKLPDTQLQNEYVRVRGYKPVDNYGDAMSREEIISELSGAQAEDLTRYGKYQLAGGENYREILLTLPAAGEDVQRLNQISMQLHGKPYTDLMADTSQMAKMRLAVKREYRNQFDESGQNAQDRGMYRSSHFDEPNILAHMRVNDRIDADGKKMLLVEEIQSDWHQAGREKGYNDPKAQNQAQQQITALKEEHKRLGKLKEQAKTEEEKNAISQQRFDLMNQVQELAKTGQTGIPDAPFKDTWYQLALKRLTKYAADNGYERIGLTTGKQQAERFDLSQQIGQINARPTPDGKIALEAMTPDMRNQVFNKVVNADELDGIVGKEIAEKIKNQIEYPKSFDDRGKSVELSGLDLSVGGEGMKKYYDEIYPKFLDKYGKKYGAKVGETQITTGYARDADGIPAQRPSKETIRYLDVTPQMKEGTSKGQPLFAATPLLPATSLLDEEKRKEITSLLE
jgi:hypothetical protein